MSVITPQQAIERRELVVVNPFSGKAHRYNGKTVYSVTELGVVIRAGSTSRIFYPWSKVESFTYHMADEKARNIIQGY